MQGLGLISVLIWLPIAAGIAVLALGDRRIAMARWVALIASLAFSAWALRLALSTRSRTTPG